MACHTSWFPLLHRDLLLMIMSFAISFFLIGNQKYPPHLWLILDLANGYLMVRGWRGWSLQQLKDLFDAKAEEQRVKSSRLQPALPHRPCILILPHCQSSSSTGTTHTELMTHSADARTLLWNTFLTLVSSKVSSFVPTARWEELKFIPTWLSPIFKQNA